MLIDKMNNINFILSSHIFKGIAKDNFMNKFFNFFVKLKVCRGEKLIIEGSDPKYLYVIKEGQFEISSTNNINELKEISKNLLGNLKESIFDNLIKKHGNKNKFINQRKKHKVITFLLS